MVAMSNNGIKSIELSITDRNEPAMKRAKTDYTKYETGWFSSISNAIFGKRTDL